MRKITFSREELNWMRNNSSKKDKSELKGFIKEKKYKKQKRIKEDIVDDKKTVWIKENRKKLLSRQTSSEKDFYEVLELLDIPFEKQYPFSIKGNIFFADAVFLNNKVIIEIDGGYHNIAKVKKNDDKRTKLLNKIGYKVVRISNDDVLDVLKVMGILEPYLPIKVSAYKYI